MSGHGPQPPLPGPARRFRFPDFTEHRLDNGLRLLALERRRVPLVHLELAVDAGAELDPPAAAGTAALTAAVWDEGTSRSDSRDIARRIESRGGRLQTAAGWDASTLAVALPSSELFPALELAAELATDAAFPGAEADRLRAQTLAELERRDRQPDSVATMVLEERIYGPGRYGSPLAGSRESVGRLERDDLARFFAAHANAAGAALVVAGDFEVAALAERVRELFGGWRGGGAPARPQLAPSAGGGVRVTVVDRPQATQTELRIGQPGIRRADPDYVAARLLSSVLGGKFTSRINLSLREKHGITYGASSHFAARRAAGPLVVAAAVETGATALATREVIAELERLRQEVIGEDELGEARDYLTGVQAFAAQTLASLASRLVEVAIYDLERDYWQRYAERLRDVSGERIRDLARRLLRPDALAVVAVGPARELAGPLAEIGPVEVTAMPS